MGRNWWGKFIFLLAMTGLAGAYVYPTVANLDLEKTKFPVKQKINLGLDLQGGLYMVMGVDFNSVFRSIIDRDAMKLDARLKEKNFPAKSVRAVREGYEADDPRINLEFDAAQRDKIYNLIKEEHSNLRVTADQPGVMQLGISVEYRRELREDTVNRSIEVIRNRIDEFGVSEPSITSQGFDRVVVELPGVKEIDRAKDLIGRTAKLEFRIVADKLMAPDQVAQLVAQVEKDNGLAYKEGERFSDYVRTVNEKAKGKLPEGTEIAFERVKSLTGENTQERIAYLLFSKAEVTGDDLSGANVAFNPEDSKPYVAFEMNPKGAAAFGKLTGDHVQERLAIVLDSIVHSAPVIQSKISDRGQITLGGSGGQKVMQEAKDLAIVLRAGALPAQLEFLEQRVVGPSLGQDSIRKGTRAAFFGVLMVLIFTTLYYRKSGIIAVVSLVLNALFVVAILVGIDATLTLPGIAGIALTIGIAVDSNVVIYERIREELAAGKRVIAAVEAGFQKAFRTILDANVANAVAAMVLLFYGTGPIRGFATTMLIGIVTTLFTAVFVCRLFFDFYLKRLEARPQATLSI